MSGNDGDQRSPKWVKPIVFCGLVVAFSALLFALFYQIHYAQEAADGAADYASNAAREAYEPCHVSPRTKLDKCLADAHREYELKRNDNRRDYADLIAQQRAALWAAVMGVAALIGMALSAIGIWLVYTTFRETRRTADAAFHANDIARSAQRPWLHFEELQVWISRHCEVKTYVINSGTAPALDVMMSIDAYAWDKFNEDTRKYYANPAVRILYPKGVSNIPPGGRALATVMNGRELSDVGIVVAVTVWYRDTNSDDYKRTTEFYHAIKSIDDQNRWVPFTSADFAAATAEESRKIKYLATIECAGGGAMT